MNERIGALALLLFGPLAFAAGCRSQAIDRTAQQEFDEIDRDVENNVVSPSCPDGSRLGPGCGLIAKAMGAESFRARFRQAYCEDIDDHACQSLFERMFQANLVKRYGGADFERVALECDAAPRSCDNPADYERRLLASHNEAVIAMGVDRTHEAMERRERRQREHAEHVAKIVGEVGWVLSDRPKCRSYPSVFGGVTNTICTEK